MWQPDTTGQRWVLSFLWLSSDSTTTLENLHKITFHFDSSIEKLGVDGKVSLIIDLSEQLYSLRRVVLG